MRVTYLLISTLLLIANSCFGDSSTNSESQSGTARPNIYDLFDENSDGVGEDHTKFTNLSADAQFYILTHMNVTELLNVSMTYPKFSAIVNEGFNRKYKDYYIGVDLVNLTECDEYQTDQLYTISDAQKFIIIRDCKFAVDFLQHFKVKIFGIDQTIRDDNNMAPITLLYLEKLTEGNPFEEVEEFRWRVDRNVTNMRPLDELFPKLRKILIGLSVELDNSFVDVHIPNLDDVWMVFDVSNRDGVESQLEPLLRKNPQVRSFFLMFEGRGSVAPDYAKEINKILPKLENLTLWRFDSDGTVRFENMKVFSFMDRESHSLHKLYFPRLESFDMVYNEAKAEDMIEFFQNHRNLHKLWFRIWGRDHQPVQQRLEEILSHLNNLAEFIAEESLSVDVILRIAKNKGKLQKFMFNVDKFNESEMKEIHEQLDNEWTFSEAKLEHKRSEHYLLAERK